MLDVAGTELTDDDRRPTRHPLVGGVILFTATIVIRRSCRTDHGNPCAQIRPLLIGVDHEGGRVQRFREGFTACRDAGLRRNLERTPASARANWHVKPAMSSQRVARAWGGTSASRRYSIWITARPASSAIAPFMPTRMPCFKLGQAVMLGMKDAGMAACGKHFPGHGFVVADSHVDIPVDERSLADIAVTDLVPFRLMIEAGLSALMPAHVIYPGSTPCRPGFHVCGCKRCCASNWVSTARFQRRSVHGSRSGGGRRGRAGGGSAQCGL